MKDGLLKVLNANPTLAAKGPEFLDDLAEDMQAVIIRALGLPQPNEQLAQLEYDVDALYVSQFGVQLSNLLFQHHNLAGAPQKSVTRAMLQTYFLEHGQGAALKARLQSLAAVV